MILLILTTFYAAALIAIHFGLYRLKCPNIRGRPFVSIVVAARNEIKYIETLLLSLLQQDYPDDRYEIIIIDDQSSDGTLSILYDYQKKYPSNVTIYTTTNRNVISPKKQAIARGISKANGEIVLLTDADCIPPPTWITHLLLWLTPETGMVIGFSPYEKPAINRCFQRFQAVDSLSLAALTAATTGWNHPATCNGRNLAYRKKVFEQVGGFKSIENFVSGDDDLFLKQVKKRSTWEIRYAFDPLTAVPTHFVDNFKQFYNQRLRHASKGFHYSGLKTILLAILYFYNVLFFYSFAVIPVTGFNIWLFGATALKACAEFLLLFAFAISMKKLHFLKYFPIAFILHIPYVVVFGALGQLKKFKWKENNQTA